MLAAAPGETITVTQSGLPTGLTVGFQVVKAATGTIAIGRSTVGVVERPSGSGNYVAVFVAPAEADLYLVVLDWSGGTLAPETTVVQELQVSSLSSVLDTGLGEIADRLKVAIGGESFKGLLDSPTFGSSSISVAIETVKHRVRSAPPDTAGEASLPSAVLSYLAKLAGLELMPAIRDYWMTQQQSAVFGNDPAETINYPSRTAILDALEQTLLRQSSAEAGVAISLIVDPVFVTTGGPAIDEDDESSYVTRDPRVFPREDHYPFRGGLIGFRRDW